MACFRPVVAMDGSCERIRQETSDWPPGLADGSSYAMRFLFAICLVGLVLLCFPSSAQAEEIFVLDNGTVLHGFVSRDGEEELTIRLVGLGKPVHVTVRRDQIVERHTSRRREPTVLPGTPARTNVPIDVARQPPAPEPVTTGPRRPPVQVRERLAPVPGPILAPEYGEEGFISHFLGLARVTIPRRPQAMALIALLLVGLLAVLVHAGAQLADLGKSTLPASLGLGALFAASFVLNVLHPEVLLRADLAVIVVPLEFAVWVGAARWTLGGTIGRATLLFAFVLFSLLSVVFVTGAIFVAV